MPTVAQALQMGWRHHQAGELSAAEDVYRRVLQVAPHNEKAWCCLGMACHDQSRYREALDAYEMALRIKADFPVALNNLANTLKQLGRFDEAIARVRKPFATNPTTAPHTTTWVSFSSRWADSKKLRHIFKRHSH